MFFSVTFFLIRSADNGKLFSGIEILDQSAEVLLFLTPTSTNLANQTANGHDDSKETNAEDHCNGHCVFLGPSSLENTTYFDLTN